MGGRLLFLGRVMFECCQSQKHKEIKVLERRYFIVWFYLFGSWYIWSAASAAVVIKQGSHMKNKTLRSHRMKMERMKMSFYQNIIEVFLVFFKHTKKKICRCCSVITLLVQFLQAHCAALDQLRKRLDWREWVCDTARRLRCEWIQNVPTHSAVCPPLLCEAVSAVLSNVIPVCCSGACQTMTLTTLRAKPNAWSGGQKSQKYQKQCRKCSSCNRRSHSGVSVLWCICVPVLVHVSM